MGPTNLLAAYHLVTVYAVNGQKNGDFIANDR
jgi:hypothetical protein